MKNILTISLLLLSTLVMAENKVVLDVSLSPVGSFQATSKKPKGTITKTTEGFESNSITVSIESFKTGIDLRDEHFWKYLNSSKHPRATLTNLKAKNGKATADLEVNGTKKPININYKIIENEVVANFTVNASDFGLLKAEYVGVSVSNEVKAEVTMEYK